MCQASWLFRKVDEEQMFSTKMSHLAAALVIARVHWYAFPIPQEEMMEGYPMRWQRRRYSLILPACTYNCSMPLAAQSAPG